MGHIPSIQRDSVPSQITIAAVKTQVISEADQLVSSDKESAASRSMVLLIGLHPSETTDVHRDVFRALPDLVYM